VTDVEAYYNVHAQEWQLLIKIDQTSLDKLLNDEAEIVGDLKSLIDDATMRALGY